MKRFLLNIVVLCVISLFGCRNLYDLGDNIINNFSSPELVKNKITNPVKDSVRLSALWVGHATVLIQIYDKVILTDPFFTNNIAELQKRIIEPGIDLKDLNRCDLILISHSHFDHLNVGSLSLLEDKFPKCDLVFPEGLEEFLPRLSFNFHSFKRGNKEEKIYIGETRKVNDVIITTVVAYHWGGRYGLDGLIWGSESFTGFIIQYKDVTVYFSGDTAYDKDFFKYLGNNYKIDIEFIPIGPCKDCEKIHKKNKHVYPKGALKILEDSKAKIMIPIHYGTIKELSDPNKPKYVLQDLLLNKPELKDRVKILKIGEQIILN
jgi:N-acyl-phosphatidylethanolamine-hydrolysing phospholipase D